MPNQISLGGCALRRIYIETSKTEVAARLYARINIGTARGKNSLSGSVADPDPRSGALIYIVL